MNSVCDCGARGEHRNCAARRRDGLAEQVLEAVEQHGPVSSTETQLFVCRRRSTVRATLRALEAEGRIERTDRGWRAAP